MRVEGCSVGKPINYYLFIYLYFLTVPTAPRSLMVVNVTNSTVSLSWMLPSTTNGIITQYQVQYRRSNSSGFTLLNITNNTLTHTVTGLSSNTEYVFRVRAYTVVGHGPSSNPVVDYTGKLKISITIDSFVMFEGNHITESKCVVNS